MATKEDSERSKGDTKKSKSDQVPPAFAVSNEDADKALVYWKAKRKTARRECTRRANQVKAVLAQGPGAATRQKLQRYRANLEVIREDAHQVVVNLTTLGEDESENEEFLENLTTEIDQLLDLIDDSTSGASGQATKGASKNTGFYQDDSDNDSDGDSQISRLSISSRDKSMYTMMSMTYDISKDVPKFDGSDIAEFDAWLTQWNAAEVKLTAMDKSPADKLLALKRCLKGRALDYIKGVKIGDRANFDGAKQMLIEYYHDRQTTGKVLVDKLLALPEMTKDLDTVENVFFQLRSIWANFEGLELTGAQGLTLLFCAIAETKLSPGIRKSWAKKMEEKADADHPIGHAATENDLFYVVNREIKLQRALNSGKSTSKKEAEPKKNSGNANKNDSSKGTLQGSFSTQQRQALVCLICGADGHKAADCQKLKNLKSAEERTKFLSDNRVNVCRNCLKGKHFTAECRQGAQCKVQGCGKPHHTLLHRQARRPQSSVAQPARSEPSGGSGPENAPGDKAVNVASAGPLTSTPILLTCRAWVMGSKGEQVLANLFLDSGSEVTLMTRAMAARLGLSGPSHQLSLTGVGGVKLPTTTERIVTFKLRSLKGDFTSDEMKAITKQRLTDAIREVHVDMTKYPHLKDLQICEEVPRSTTEVDILVGVDYFATLLGGESITGQPGEPVALATKLGFVLAGTA